MFLYLTAARYVLPIHRDIFKIRLVGLRRQIHATSGVAMLI